MYEYEQMCVQLSFSESLAVWRQTYHTMWLTVLVFRRVIEHTRGLDATRPVTFVMSGASSPFTDKAVRTDFNR